MPDKLILNKAQIKREEDITAALVFLQDNYKKRKVNIELTANRTLVNKCLNKFSLDDIKRGIMFTISEKVGKEIKGQSLEKYLKVSTIFAVENMGKYVSDSEGKEIISDEDVEKIIKYGETKIEEFFNMDYRSAMKNKIIEIISEGHETKSSFCELLTYAPKKSYNWKNWEQLTKSHKYLREIVDSLKND